MRTEKGKSVHLPAHKKVQRRRPGRPPHTKREPVGIHAVELGLKILEQLAATESAVSLGDLSEMTGVQPSKIHRYLVSFVRAGMVSHSPLTGLYDLGPAARRIGLSAFNRHDGLALAHERIATLRHETGHTFALYVWTEAGATLVRWEMGVPALPLALRVGSTLPLTRSATGRLFLAYVPEPLTAPIVKRERILDQADGLPPIRPEDLDQLLAEIRSNQLSTDADTIFRGVEALSVPTFNFTGEIFCAITALIQRRHLNEVSRAQLAERLRTEVAELSAELGFRPAQERFLLKPRQIDGGQSGG
jgi:DNA-binding IclR family transcriptional regulator